MAVCTVRPREPGAGMARQSRGAAMPVRRRHVARLRRWCIAGQATGGPRARVRMRCGKLPAEPTCVSQCASDTDKCQSMRSDAATAAGTGCKFRARLTGRRLPIRSTIVADHVGCRVPGERDRVRGRLAVLPGVPDRRRHTLTDQKAMNKPNSERPVARPPIEGLPRWRGSSVGPREVRCSTVRWATARRSAGTVGVRLGELVEEPQQFDRERHHQRAVLLRGDVDDRL